MTLAHWPMYLLALVALVWIVWSERRRTKRRDASDSYIADLKKSRERRALQAAQKGLRS